MLAIYFNLEENINFCFHCSLYNPDYQKYKKKMELFMRKWHPLKLCNKISLKILFVCIFIVLWQKLFSSVAYKNNCGESQIQFRHIDHTADHWTNLKDFFNWKKYERKIELKKCFSIIFWYFFQSSRCYYSWDVTLLFHIRQRFFFCFFLHSFAIKLVFYECYSNFKSYNKYKLYSFFLLLQQFMSP